MWPFNNCHDIYDEMKAVTHYAFSAGVSVYLLSIFGLLSFSSVLFALWLSFSVNYVIDVAGHANRNGNPVRTRLTHSVFTAPLWGALVSAASLFFLLQVARWGSPAVVVLWITAGTLVALGHLMLDSMTQAGVYYWKHRIAMAHFRYDNPAVNLGFIVLGLGLLGVALLGPGFFPMLQ